VRQRPRRLETFYAPIDARRLEDADQDRKGPLSSHFLQVNDLLVVDFVDDDA
jgi:hypothetical protein